ncbi:hypothetical protein EMPS_10017 [Entomortierella parvispora]|uniref:Uncharacterized protein n=1 Tax=Entomortierella parvispora TaxID=205924 RepID=A0A9P3HJP3_9FUNG|nr:hypothetical protein EMPS_10017 [Entomortierella parvispora]
MFHEPMLHETFMTLFPTIPNCYHANVIWYRSMVELRSRIELAMFERVAPQLVTLTIAMGIQVPRIKVPWLSSLRRLEVAGTDVCLLTERNLSAGVDGHTTRILDDLAGIDTRALEDFAMTKLDRMLTFIWDHQRIFGTLRELKIEIKGVQFQNQPSYQLIELVEAMGDALEVLDVQFWPEAVLYLDRIPTRNLKSLLLHQMKDPEPFLERRRTMAAFLRQCPKLDTIKMYTAEKDLLESWRSRAGRSRDSLDMMLPRFRALSLGPQSEVRRSKLIDISIAGLAQDVIAIVNEAVDMFAPDLKSISVRSWFNGRLMPTPLSWSDSDTPLQQLTDLNLEGEVSWTFDYGSLSKCPRLSRVRLAFTGPMPSRSAKKQPAIGLLAQVSTLRDLELVGHWETLDNKGWPAVVARIERLERLDLKGCEGMTADQAFRIELTIVENSRMNQKESNAECALRWIIVNKRLEDALARLRHNHLRQQTPPGSPTRRVRYSFVASARPSH